MPYGKSEKWKWSRSDVSDSLRPHGLQPTRLLHPWDFPGKSTGVGCHRLSVQFSSLQFSRSVVSDSSRPHESQHARPPCPSPTPGVHSNSHPLSQWCHPAISFCCPLPPAPNPSQHQSPLVRGMQSPQNAIEHNLMVACLCSMIKIIILWFLEH